MKLFTQSVSATAAAVTALGFSGDKLAVGTSDGAVSLCATKV